MTQIALDNPPALQDAEALHRAGDLVAASQMLHTIIGADPTSARAYHLLGVIAYQTGQSAAALESLAQAIRLQPDNGDIYSDLGSVLNSLEEIEAAESAFRAAISLKPDSPSAYNNLGNLLRNLGRDQEAGTCFTAALDLHPSFAEAHNNLGCLQKRLGRPDLALSSLHTAVGLRPDSPEIHNNLGDALRDLNRPRDAEASYAAAIALRPAYAEAHNNLGNALHDQQRFAQALASYAQAVRLRPDYAEALSNVGAALRDLGRLADAEAYCRQAIRLRPTLAEAHSSLGTIRHQMGHFSEAVAHLSTAVSLKPADALMRNNYGAALQHAGRPYDAIAALEEACDRAPELADAWNNLGMALLLVGRFEEGWRVSEWRWRSRQFLAGARGFDQPLWDGSTAPRTLLIHAEQGLGDALQFCRFIPLVAADHEVVLEVDASLVSLLGRLPGVAQVIARGQPLPAFDAHCPIMSLPLVFGTTLETIPAADAPYLHVDPIGIQAWRKRLEALPGLKVGLVWAGGSRPNQPEAEAVNRRRSLALAQLAPLAEVAGVSFVSLQKGGSGEAASPPPGMTLHDFTADLQSFEDTAALVMALDLVISVDTAVAHLAGALGKPVWVLNRFDTCWRWLLDRADSPWYRSLRLFRQPSPGDWISAIDDAKGALHDQVAARSVPPSP